MREIWLLIEFFKNILVFLIYEAYPEYPLPYLKSSLYISHAPYYTLEVCDGKIKQVKGKFNHAPDDEMKKFIAEFAKDKNLQYSEAVY